MGYTHYWAIDRRITVAEMAALAGDVRKIVAASGVPIAGWDGDGEPEYGNERGEYGYRIALNGARPDNHETFAINAKGGWDFCKTGRDRYDVVVTASLLALKDRLGAAVRLESDGYPSDWGEGRDLARRALGRPIADFIEEETTL